jgi:hypothetical protein
MSENAVRDRYTFLKKYTADYLSSYHELKAGMKGMKDYEDTLRRHFQRLYDGYINPFDNEIKALQS